MTVEVVQQHGSASSVLYPEMGHEDLGQRISLRTGEILINAAARTEEVRRALAFTGRDFRQIAGEEEDMLNFAPTAVIERVRRIVGLRGAVKVVDNAVDYLSSADFLNGDRDFVRENLLVIQAGLSEERREALIATELRAGAQRVQRGAAGQVRRALNRKFTNTA